MMTTIKRISAEINEISKVRRAFDPDIEKVKGSENMKDLQENMKKLKINVFGEGSGDETGRLEKMKKKLKSNVFDKGSGDETGDGDDDEAERREKFIKYNIHCKQFSKKPEDRLNCDQKIAIAERQEERAAKTAKERATKIEEDKRRVRNRSQGTTSERERIRRQR